MECTGMRAPDLARCRTSAVPGLLRGPRIPKMRPGVSKQQSASNQRSRVTQCAAYAAQPANPAPQLNPVLRWFKWLPDKQAGRLVADAWALLYSNIWAVVAIYLAKDAAAFALHRLAHRLTNHIAEGLLGMPISTMGNPWWIMADAKFMEGNIGYQVLVGCFFLLCLPLNILFNTAAFSTAALVCTTRRATASSAPAVPSASFSGQGSGKVGLAECRSTTSSMDGCDVPYSSASSSSSSVVASSTSRTSSGSTKQSSSEHSSSSSSSSAGAAGVVAFRGPGIVSFRRAGGSSSSESKRGVGKQASKRLLRPPAAAPAVPWLAAAQEQPQRQQLPPPLGIKPSLAMVKDVWGKQVQARLRQLWEVDIRFNLWSLPLQAACLAVLPAFWAFPRLLGVQLSLPAAVLGGAQGNEALQRSRQLMEGFRSSYAWPYAWLIVAGRMLEVVRELVLVSMPVRWWTDVIEVPLVATAVFAAARVLLLRLQDLLPLVAYMQRSAQAAAGAGDAEQQPSRDKA